MSDAWEYNIGSIIQNVIKKFSSRPDISGVIIFDEEGFPLSSNLPSEQSELISAHASDILQKSLATIKAVKNSGELTSISIETNTRELIFTPDKDLPLIFALVRNLS
ncbi:MAG: roadblock/LC7 domain-containing protein [Candidatus Hodarchaeales archaeon]|jgi:predicted regulator of Ras-like GTPase activity (Roadblock/LC7/MglB family)